MLSRAFCSLFINIFKDEQSTMLLVSRLIDDLNLKGILCCHLSFTYSCTLPGSVSLSMCSIKLVCLTFPLWSCSPGLGQATAWCWHSRAYSMFSVLILSLLVPTCHWRQQSWGPGQHLGAAEHTDWSLSLPHVPEPFLLMSLCVSSSCPCATLSRFSCHIQPKGGRKWAVGVLSRPWETWVSF